MLVYLFVCLVLVCSCMFVLFYEEKYRMRSGETLCAKREPKDRTWPKMKENEGKGERLIINYPIAVLREEKKRRIFGDKMNPRS